jgi:hypothetical protein
MIFNRDQEKIEFMMRKTRILISVFIAVVLAEAALPAQAAMESFSTNYGSASDSFVVVDGTYAPNSDFPTTVNLPKFDPSLGTLTDIVLKLSSTDIVGSEVCNVTRFSQSYTGAFVNELTVQITGPDSLQTTTTLSAGPSSGTVAPYTFAHAGSPSEATAFGLTDVPPADFCRFTGSGLVAINLCANAPTGTFGGSGPLGVFFGAYADCYGAVEIDYVYSAVPETGTLTAGLAALGYCLVNLVRRSRWIRS